MTGKTHKVYSVLFSFIFTIILYNDKVSQINYYLSLIIILLVARKGALFPDLDHSWTKVHEKTVPNKIINTIISITGGKHRSWQTHSIDICTIFTLSSIILTNYLHKKEYISTVNKEVLLIILLGFASGWISHLFSDMLTSEGVRLFCWLKFKIKFVPRKISIPKIKIVKLKLKIIREEIIRFNTGNEWEQFNYKIISILNKIVGFICIIYPIIKKEHILEIIRFIGGFL